jgi:ferritin-like metal-binding protein YciE
MPELNDRDQKLVQYLNEAYGKEKELETALQAHIGMTTRAPYKKRLQQHLRETKSHARQVEQRIRRLGGDPQTLQRIASQATAALKGPLHALRGSGEEEKLLKNAKTEYSEEAEEIATYTAIEAFAENVGDRETAKLARGIRREEERMATYLARLIPQLTRAVVRSEVPSNQRAGERSTRRRSSGRATARRRSTARGATGRGTARQGSAARRTAARRASGRRSTGRRSR